MVSWPLDSGTHNPAQPEPIRVAWCFGLQTRASGNHPISAERESDCLPGSEPMGSKLSNLYPVRPELLEGALTTPSLRR
jgi:hypothetical protein